MYVLTIARGYPSKKWPLYGVFEFDQAKALQKIGHKVVFASIDLRSLRRWRNWGLSYSVNNGIEIYNVSIPLGRMPWRIHYFFGKIGILCLFRSILSKTGKPDIVHAHFTMPGAIASILKKKYGIPLVVTEHSSTIHRKVINRTTFSIGKIAYENADKIISVSFSLSKRIKQNFGYNSVVVSNIADTSNFSFREKAADKRFTFISVGDLIYQKGFDLLINAFHKANFNIDVRLYIIGKGRLFTCLQKEIGAFGLNEQIRLLGLMNRTEIAGLMQKSDAFILASRGETFGVAIVEAMLSGLPVISTACGGPEELVDENNGILVPVENVDMLTKAMLDMYNNINRYNRVQISQLCRSNFSPEVIGNHLTKIYDEVINLKE